MDQLAQTVEKALRRLGPPPDAAAAGVLLMPGAATAFAMRVATARAAARTLDLQYYIWRSDVTGQLLAREALRAADRGVAVRILLDDVYALGRERVLSALDEHPCIEVRVFNATRWRRFGRLGMLLEILFGGRHLSRRMHNKAWIADGCLAVLGGRNLGDEYFGLAGEGVLHFRDLDVAIAGAPAREASLVFSRYWHSALARPAAKVAAHAPATGGLAAMRASLDSGAGTHRASRLLGPFARAGLRMVQQRLTSVGPRDVRVVADPPEKARRGLRARRLARTAGGIAADIADALRAARGEALLISPYFVPGKAGLGLLRELRDRDVRVSVVTNSLAATDVVAAHGGYARYRPALIEAGIELFELKRGAREERASLFGSRGAALHTKALVVDRSLAFVGSFNLDPRSAALNTEMGAFMRSATVAAGVAAEHARLAAPARSWRVVLRDGRLTWLDDAQATTREPAAGAWRRSFAAVIRRLPLEDQL